MRTRVWIPLPAVFLTLLQVWLMHRTMMRYTGGEVTYPVDDAFIHLAMAKRIAFAGEYGLGDGFVSASSSISWPFLLAGVLRFVGGGAFAPLWMNGVLGCLAPYAVDATVLRIHADARPWQRVVMAMVVTTLSLVPTLVCVGMEHTLHLVLFVLFVGLSVDLLQGGRLSRSLLVVSLLLGSVRYEGLFPISAIALTLFAKRRVREALMLGLSGFTIPALFGAVLFAKTGHVLPLSVLLKRRVYPFREPSDFVDFLGGDLFHRLAGELHLAVPCLLLAMVFAATFLVEVSSRVRASLALVLLCTAFHLQFGGLGWFYRYDAYLVAALLTVLGGALLVLFRDKPWALFAMVLLVTGVLLRRTLEATSFTPSAGRNIFEQQVQTARFLSTHFADDKVLVNDIGAATYYRSGGVVDLMGLGHKEVAEQKGLRIERPPSREFLERLSADAPVAVVYDEWFRGSIPASWFRVATWTIESNRSCAFPQVSVFATRANAIGKVLSATRAFERVLPSGVHVEGVSSESHSGVLRTDDVVRARWNTPQGMRDLLTRISPKGTVLLDGLEVKVRGYPRDGAPLPLPLVSLDVVVPRPGRAYVAGPGGPVSVPLGSLDSTAFATADVIRFEEGEFRMLVRPGQFVDQDIVLLRTHP